MDCGTTVDDRDALIMRVRIGHRATIYRFKREDGSGPSTHDLAACESLSSTQLRRVLGEHSHLAMHHQPAALTHCKGARRSFFRKGCLELLQSV